MTETPTSRALPRESLTIAAGPTDDTSVILLLTGRLDAVAAPELRIELDRWIGTGHTHLLVDLSAVSFIDSAGLAVLVRARRLSREAGGDVALVSPGSDAAMRVFRLTQFDQVFRMLPTRGR